MTSSLGHPNSRNQWNYKVDIANIENCEKIPKLHCNACQGILLISPTFDYEIPPSLPILHS